MIRPQPLDLGELVRNTHRMLRRLIGEDIELAIPPSQTPAGVKADRGQLEQVLLNLAINARDAMPRGGRLAIDVKTVTLSASHPVAGEEMPAGSYVRLAVSDSGSGMDLPAAVIVECVQGEGGINVASPGWLRELARRCQARGILLIVDDVQMGCGRTGPFFSFEAAGITPDIVCLSKSIGGYGLPLALTLLRPGLDIWAPGEHSGTFRGFDPALVTGAAALRAYWSDRGLEKRTAANGEVVAAALAEIADGVPGASTRGRGLVHGLEFSQPGMAQKVAAAAFDLGMLVETAGPADQVVKLMPPLTIGYGELTLGLSLLATAVTRTAM